MASPSLRLAILRATESLCMKEGVDALSLEKVAEAVGESRTAVAHFFHDEMSLLDAVLERHQSVYERPWGDLLPALETARAVIRLLAKTIVQQIHDEDGGAAYVVIAAQMCTSTRFALAGRPATTSPAALQLMGKLMGFSKVPFDVLPIHFERFAVVLFSSVAGWYRHGAARMPEDMFLDDLVDTLEFIGVGEVTRKSTGLVAPSLAR